MDSVFIIDPLYTLPLAAGLLITLFTRHRRPVLLALAVSTMYLGWSVGAKSVADHHMKRTFVDFGVSTERYMSTPTALNTLLYIGMADTGDSLVTTTFSLVDGRRPTPPRTVATRRALLQAHLRDRAVSRVDWFSKGWWLARETGDGIEMIDPRFGRSDLFLTGSGHYVFRFKLRADSSGDYYSFYQMPPELLDPGALLGSVRDRVTGHQPDGDRRRNADSAGTYAPTDLRRQYP